jgi:hypothetical protein
MRHTTIFVVFLSACGGSSSHNSDGAPGTADAPPGTADAPPGTADAPPGTPDAMIGGTPDAAPPPPCATCDYKATIGGFMDITSLGESHQFTMLNADDVVETFTLPFSFPFYGTATSTIGVTTNGTINLGATAGVSTDPNNRDLPSTLAPGPTIFTYWDDLHPAGVGTVWINTRGYAPHQFAIIEWKDFELVSNPGSRLTFEAIIWEDGRIQFLYDMATAGPGAAAGEVFGGGATAGLQDSLGVNGVEVGPINTPDLAPGLIVTFTPTTTASYEIATSHELVSEWQQLLSTTALASMASNCDDCAENITLPFVFDFFGAAYGPGQATTDVTVTSNGTLSFGPNAPGFVNQSFPSAAGPYNVIACFWDDLDTTNTVAMGSEIRSDVFGVAPNRQFVIQYYGIPTAANHADRVSFEVALYETTNRIECRYGPSLGTDGQVFGDSATIGLNGPDGTTGAQASFNTPNISQGSTVEFLPSSNADTTAYTIVGPSPGLSDISQITGVMTAGSAIDFADGFVHVDIGFPFSFYGTSYSQVYLDSYGGLSFASGGMPTPTYPLPSILSPSPKIAATWGQMVTNGPVYYVTTGSPGSRVFTAQFQTEQNQLFFGGGTSYMTTWAVRLYEVDNSIEIDYGAQQNSTPGSATGAYATVGIDGDGMHGINICWDQQDSLMSGSTLRFVP